MNFKNPMNFDIRIFNKENVSDEFINQYFDLINSIWKEMHPLEPLPSIDSLKQHFFEPIPNKNSFSWIAFKENKLVGSCDLLTESSNSPFFEERKNKGQFWMNVMENHRRIGLGTEMLKTIVNKASEFEYIESLELTGSTPLKESIVFCEKFGGEVTFESEENRVYMNDIDWKKIELMKVRGYQETSGFTVEIFEKIPESIIEDYAKALSEFQSIKPYNEIPKEDRISATRLRNFESKLIDDKIRWIHFLVINKNGEIMALSNLRYHFDALERINETSAWVGSDYCETKIKEVLKAEMLLYIKKKFPRVNKIYVLLEHPSMEKLNKEIGFTKHYQGKNFKFNLKDLKNYCDST